MKSSEKTVKTPLGDAILTVKKGMRSRQNDPYVVAKVAEAQKTLDQIKLPQPH